VTFKEFAMRSVFARSLWVAATLGLSLPPALRGQQAASAGPQATAPDPANTALARQLLKAMHTDENLVATIEAGMNAQRRVNTQMPAVFFDSLVARMKRNAHEITDSLAPLYAQGLSAQQLHAMIQFYESPPGQALALQQIAVSPQGAAIGQRWGARLGADVAKDLVNAGVDLQAH
jgi:hypothetical protein